MAVQQQISASQLNSIARQAIKARGVRMLQSVYSQTVTPSNNPTLTINPRNVGLINGFWIKIVATVNNTSGETIDITDFGPANVLAQVQFIDLSNNYRVQTMGWHLAFLNAWKSRRAFLSALIGAGGTNTGAQTTGASAGEDDPINFGSNWTLNSAPRTISTSSTGTVTMWYWVPLAYNPDNPQTPDLRGAVYANVVNATMQLNLTFAGQGFGTSVCAANGADQTLAMYVQATTGGTASSVTLSSATVTVYQDYWDQIPTGPNGLLLPILDLSTIYELKYTTVNSMVAGTDFPYQFANFRDFLSACAVYVNNGSTGARGTGSDITYWALQSANFTNIYKAEPSFFAGLARNHIGLDFPPGTYWFDYRTKPISTTQYGNMELILNASTATNSPYMLVGVEDFAIVQQLSMAGSLAAS
jgi:P3 major capsid protein